MYMSGDFVVLYPPSRLWPASNQQLMWQQCKCVIKKVTFSLTDNHHILVE